MDKTMDAFLIIMLILIAFLLALIAFAIGELTKSVKALPQEVGRVMTSLDRPNLPEDGKG
jgi:hypothetical protein